jgi:iron complex transport system ATP-binding protein
VRKAIEAKNLSVSYNENKVLRDFSITIYEGDFTSILGPNGAGKTTLMKALTGVIKNVTGEIFIFGKPLRYYKRRDFARHVSFLPQDPQISLPFLVRDIVMMGRFPYLRRFEMEGPHDSEVVDYAMRLMGIENLASRRLGELSGGEVKRVFIAQAIAQESDILFLDEPIANLDINYQNEIFRMLKKFNEEMKKTIVIITHDINHALRFARRVVLLKNGRIVREGMVDEVVNIDTIRSVFKTDAWIEYDRDGRPYVLF